MSEVMLHVVDEPEISFTESAIKHLTTYLDNHTEHGAVRLSVKKTGCSGWSYVVEYVTDSREGDLVKPLIKGYFVYIDKISYPFIKNMQIDYVKQGIGYKFMFNNPNQTGQCGCGESFTIK